MDIHKPKPWHGVREFLKEYVIIVVGVLTALGAEQAVEWLHWRHEVHVASEAIAFDFKRLVGGSAAQDAHTVCTGRRLREIAAVIDQAQLTKRLPPMGWNVEPPTPSWSLRSWTALTAGQTLTHFPNREQIILAGIARYLERMRELSAAESDDWATLRTLASPGRATTDAEIAASRVALSRAARDAGLLRNLARQLETMIAESGLIDRRDLEAGYKEGVELGPTALFCVSPAPTSDAFPGLDRGLTGPPARPGEVRGVNPGVGRAFTVEK